MNRGGLSIFQDLLQILDCFDIFTIEVFHLLDSVFFQGGVILVNFVSSVNGVNVILYQCYWFDFLC